MIYAHIESAPQNAHGVSSQAHLYYAVFINFTGHVLIGSCLAIRERNRLGKIPHLGDLRMTIRLATDSCVIII